MMRLMRMTWVILKPKSWQNCRILVDLFDWHRDNEFQFFARFFEDRFSHFSQAMLENSTSNNDTIERRCVIIKENSDIEEVKVCIADKEAVKELLGGDAEYKGEMEGQHIAILG